MRIKKAILILVLVIGITHTIYCSYNPNGRDYIEYSKRMEEDVINDLPISWLLMKTFTVVFGNPRGLYILSFISCMVLYFTYAQKIKNEDVLITFSLSFFWLYPIWYMSGGILRNLMGLCVLSYFLLYRDGENSIYKPLVLSMIHTPTLMVYLFYCLSEGNIKNLLYSLMSLSFMVFVGVFFDGNILESSLKPLRMLGFKMIKPLYHVPINFVGVNVLVYSIIVLSFLLYVFSKFMRGYDDGLMFWGVMMIIPFISIYSYQVQFRFLLFTFLPVLMVMLHENEKETTTQKLYICVISLLSILVSVYG